MPKRTTISLFTGAGGLDLGLEAAGFELRVGLEMDRDALATLAANPERGWRVLPKNILQTPTKELLREAGLRPGEVDLLAGGPPCQPYSKSGYWATGDSRRLEDPRASTLTEFFRVLEEAQPKCFLLENVPGLSFSEKDEGIQHVEEQLGRINERLGTTKYELHTKKLNCAEYGVPQIRERIFVVGARDGSEFHFPEPTHQKPPKVRMAGGGRQKPTQARLHLEPARTAWDALADLVENDDPELAPKGKYADLLPSIPEGHNYLYLTDKGDGEPVFGWRRRYWSMLLKLAKDLPSWTLTAQPGPATGPFHWNNRRLSARELCRLQTFPDDYKIVGNLRAAQKQLGNAVPPAMAEVLGRAIRRQLLGDRVSEEASLVPPKTRSPAPPPCPVQPVPEHHLNDDRDLEPHQGTSMGPGAQERASAEASS